MSQNSTQQNSTQWDLGRFVKTLSYFGAIPFLSDLDWFQQWFGSRSDPKVDSRILAETQADLTLHQPSQILVIGADSPLGKQAVPQLRQQGHEIKLAPIQPPDLDLTKALPAELLEQVKAIVCCADAPEVTEQVLAHLRQAAQETIVRRPIFDFAHPNGDLKDIWGALDDVVMGGVSQSTMRLADGVAYFSGIVSTANSGGFASVRTRNLEPPLDLSRYEGAELRVKGDGNRYKFMLRSETRWDGVAHCFSFDTVADQWSRVQIPFADLIPVFRARTVADSPVDPGHVVAWQLMLSKFEYDGALNPHFEPGFFQLQVESIQVYRHGLPVIVLHSATDLAELNTLS
jgi:hypothetical protein